MSCFFFCCCCFVYTAGDYQGLQGENTHEPHENEKPKGTDPEQSDGRQPLHLTVDRAIQDVTKTT